MGPSLGLNRLAGLPAAVARPRYAVANVRPGIVHLGAGAFHRAHQAVYTDDLLNAGGNDDWGITDVSMRRPEVAEALLRQQGLYTVTEYDPDGAALPRVIGSVRDAMVLAADPAAVAAAIARRETRVVTLTVTEKAYYRQRGGQGLDLSAPPVSEDLQARAPGRTAVGAIVSGLDRRRAAGGEALTVACCDNLPENGVVLRRLCLDFAEAWRPGLERWIEDRVRFPSSMVDRITPATTPELIAETEEQLGCADAVPIACEAFRQWVIEDDFAGDRPPWDLGGAQFVDDVRPFEDMKLRMLNASHSALAYLGSLAGHRHISEAMAAPQFRAFVDYLMARELAPTIKNMAKSDLREYRLALLRRFSSPRPPHRLAQIAEDGSQKIPIRVLAPLRERLAAGLPADGLTVLVAGWLSFHERVAAGELPGPLRDPLATRLLEVAVTTPASARVKALPEVFDRPLAEHHGFLERLDLWYQRLAVNGTGPTLLRVVRDYAGD